MTDASRPTLLERHNSICKMLREGTGDVRCSSIDNIMPGCYVRTLAVYECTEGAAAAVAGWPAAAESLRTSLLAFVDRYLPHLSCQMFRDETRGGLLYIEGPVGRRPPHFASAVVDDWVPARADVLDGRLADWPAARLNLSAADDEPAEQQPADTATRRYNPVSLKIRATLCHKAADPAAGAYVVFVYKFHHEFMDAAASYRFLVAWAAFHRDGVVAADALTPLFFAPQLLTNVAPPQDLDASETKFPTGFTFFDFPSMIRASSDIAPGVEWTTVRLRFSNAELLRLQTEFDKAQPLVNATTGKAEKYSKNDVLVAMMWKALHAATAAVGLHKAVFGEGVIAAKVPINVRGRIPGVDEGYFGNALRPSACFVDSLDTLLSTPLIELAALVHNEVRRQASEAHVRQIFNWEETQRPTPRIPGMFLPGVKTLALTSWVVHPMYDAVFGSSIAQGSRPLLSTEYRAYDIPNLGTAVPTPPLRGSGIDVVICLPSKQVVRAMLEIPWFVGELVGPGR